MSREIYLRKSLEKGEWVKYDIKGGITRWNDKKENNFQSNGINEYSAKN